MIYGAITKEHPHILEFGDLELRKKTFNYLKKFTTDKTLLVTALIKNPFGKTDNLDVIKKKFGYRIYNNLIILNLLEDRKIKITQKEKNFQSLVMVYLANFRTLILQKKPKINKTKLKYALTLLNKCNLEIFQSELEDVLYQAIEPSVYKDYKKIVQGTKKSFRKNAHIFEDDLRKILKVEKISADFQLRFKTIYSLRNKIVKKNILHSQVLDLIGLRVIVDSIEDCYIVLGLILKHWSVMTHKIKDFIAVPKENGYQSIHVTVLYKDIPIEIQIRTQKMHYLSQYGSAAHRIYKSKDLGGDF